ncbi:MAG: discoidin domain-containing protein [Sedimentisphaerales bacterium]|nr:discoidin domain-containing protein [Sedimentisphaerales bacterium]
MRKTTTFILFLIICFCESSCVTIKTQALEKGFTNPPRQYGVRCWWWWLNSNVTKEAITRDLEEMKAKGFSGAMLFDAGGANQWGNNQVPAGPTFASDKWRQLYKHALKEAERLGLVLGLSIQSGWNLGGPNVTPDFAAKQLTWSEIDIAGPVEYKEKLPVPNSRENYYKDICVLAYPQKKQNGTASAFNVQAGSSQENQPATYAVDKDENTFWVSSGVEPGQGPTRDKPEWLQFSFGQPVTVTGINIRGRRGYGPKTCYLKTQEGQKTKTCNLADGQANEIKFDPIQGKIFQIVFEDAYDPYHPDSPRNVQVIQLTLLDQSGNPIIDEKKETTTKPIENLRLKALDRELGMSAPDCRYLLNGLPSVPGEQDTGLAEIRNITEMMTPDGTLTWSVPEGSWTVLRIGYTITDAHVSTSSADWHGRVIDYLSKDAFDRYWNEIVEPLLADAGPLVGKVLRQLETDSWECGGMNWSPDFAADFKKYRGYDTIPYLPVIAGKIVESREASNAFLADFRKTLGDCVADNHYKVFAEYAHKHNLEIQPESGGPHAGPLDAIKNLGRSDIIMGEFWIPSPHRPQPVNRFYIKQAASVAHTYGKKLVAAESFTSIGPHWNDVLWKSLKSSMDHEFCSGLNMIFFHTFTCSPKEMGIPGQEYFAGTHVNPQVTWWQYAGTFIDYINRCHYITQQGNFIADVLYYYGDHVPNVARLKEDDPAKVLPGYDYDLTSEELLLQVKVEDGRILVPGGVRYRLLALPDHKVLSLEALKKVDELLGQGANVVGPKPERLVSLAGGQQAQLQFKELADKIWGDTPEATGSRKHGQGIVFWGKTGREVLQDMKIKPDFEVKDNPQAVVDYIHYTIDDAHVYFVSNQTEDSQNVTCSFRISGRQPELWDAVTGKTRKAEAFSQSSERTDVPIQFDPYGSYFVVFSESIPSSQQGTAKSNFPDMNPVQDIQGPWQVSFDSKWGGPVSIQFEELTDWAKHPNTGIKYYSGKAMYKKTFAFSQVAKDKRYWLDLGDVEDIGIAAVRLNGNDIGVLWTKPFRTEITAALKNGDNQLEVDVINSWRNRLVGDRDLPNEKRYTKTNIVIRREWELLGSGLLGSVQILIEK